MHSKHGVESSKSTKQTMSCISDSVYNHEGNKSERNVGTLPYFMLQFIAAFFVKTLQTPQFQIILNQIRLNYI